MSRNRHSDENHARLASTPTKTRRLVACCRGTATRRRLLLLECGIIRHAPFADCGRPLWELMADLPWFWTFTPPAEWFRLREASGREPEPPVGRPWMFFRMNGHDAIRWLEQHADDGDADRLLLAEEYFRWVEWSAEADRFNTPDDLRDELEIRYGAAYWLYLLREIGPELWNVLDFYLGHYPGTFYVWGDWRPLHPDHRAVAISLIEDIFWHPFHSVRFDAGWRTPDAVAIASAMYETRDFAAAPILADALEAAGCDNNDILDHCRSAERKHCRGCWVVDQVLGKS